VAAAADIAEEQIMEWLSQNWVWVLFGVGMIAMHMFGHGGHGGHGGHCGGSRDEEQPAGKDGKQSTSKQGSGHQH
jgi:hypothetical protein